MSGDPVGEPMVRAADYSAMVARAEQAEALVGRLHKAASDYLASMTTATLYELKQALADPLGARLAEEQILGLSPQKPPLCPIRGHDAPLPVVMESGIGNPDVPITCGHCAGDLRRQLDRLAEEQRALEACYEIVKRRYLTQECRDAVAAVERARGG